MYESGHNEDTPGSKYTNSIKNWMLDEWMRYTGYDATEDTYFSWDNEQFWEELDKELDKYRK